MRPIDADKLMELYANTPDCNIDDCHVAIPVIRQNILDMPTINQYEWISVKDRLPECHLIRDIFHRPDGYMSDTVLVCVKSNECDGVRCYVGTDIMRGRTLEDLHWLMSCGYSGSAVYYQVITHWMPLPALPTIKEN